jgi:hypothetical protein
VSIKKRNYGGTFVCTHEDWPVKSKARIKQNKQTNKQTTKPRDTIIIFICFGIGARNQQKMKAQSIVHGFTIFTACMDALLVPSLWFAAGANCSSELMFLETQTLLYSFSSSLLDLEV